MGLFSKKYNAFSPEQIYVIVEAFFVMSSKAEILEILASMNKQGRMDTLLSTPQWTFVQLLDNYLTAKNNKDFYKKFVDLQKTFDISILLPEFKNNPLCTKLMFTLFVLMRPSAIGGMDEIMTEAGKVTMKDDQLEYLLELISVLQIYEAKLSPFYSGSNEDNEMIKENIDDNEKLLNVYFKYRPEYK